MIIVPITSSTYTVTLEENNKTPGEKYYTTRHRARLMLDELFGPSIQHFDVNIIKISENEVFIAFGTFTQEYNTLFKLMAE